MFSLNLESGAHFVLKKKLQTEHTIYQCWCHAPHVGTPLLRLIKCVHYVDIERRYNQTTLCNPLVNYTLNRQ